MQTEDQDEMKPLSQVIREAVGHAEECLGKGIRLVMNAWYDAKDGGLCSVCLGAAHLVGEVGLEELNGRYRSGRKVMPEGSSELYREMNALDEVRGGFYQDAYLVYHNISLHELEDDSPAYSLDNSGKHYYGGEITPETFPDFKAAILRATDLIEAVEP